MDSVPQEINRPGPRLTEFEETQIFGSTPLAAVILAATLGSVAIVIGVTAKTSPVSGGIGAAVILAVDAFFLWGLRLRTIVTRDELLVGFRPLPLKRIPLEAISKAEAVKYNPLVDAGGWGWKHSPKYGSVRNVWGEAAVAIEYSGGKRLLIGTRRADELAEAIRDRAPAAREEDDGDGRS